MSKKYILLSSALMLVFAGCQSKSQNNQVVNQVTQPVTEAPTQTITPKPKPDALEYETVTLADDQDRYYYDLEYPVFSGGKDQSAEMINTEIEDYVQEELRIFLNEFTAEDHEYDPGPWSLYVDYELKRNDAAFVSIILYMSVYTGGAHPGDYSMTFNFNLEEGGMLMSLTDIFNPMAIAINPETGMEQDYLEYISEETINELIARDISDEEAIRAGAGPDEMNYQNFYLTMDNVGFIFDPYTVAPGAAGPQEITISYEDLADFLKAYDF